MVQLTQRQADDGLVVEHAADVAADGRCVGFMTRTPSFQRLALLTNPAIELHRLRARPAAQFPHRRSARSPAGLRAKAELSAAAQC